MAEWNDTIKHPASSFNAGNQYTKNDQMSIEALNNNIENALYAARVAENAQSATNNAVSYDAQTPLATEQKQAQKNLGIDGTISFAEAERQKSKNLFNAPSITLPTGVTYNSSTNTFTYTSDEVAEGATKFAQLNNVVLPAGNYVYSFDSTSTITGDTTYIVAKLNSAGAYESQIATKVLPAGKVSIPFTLTEDTYIGLCWYYKTGWSAGSAPAGSKTISKVQLEQGSTATDYQPYYGEIVHQGDIAPVVLYDKDSTDPNINWGYPNGIASTETITITKSTRGYSKLRCYFSTGNEYTGENGGTFIVEVDLTTQINATWSPLCHNGIASTISQYSISDNAQTFEIIVCNVGVDKAKTRITINEKAWNKNAVIRRATPCYRIEGVL